MINLSENIKKLKKTKVMKTNINNPAKKTGMLLLLVAFLTATPAMSQMNSIKTDLGTIQAKLLVNAEEVMEAVKDYRYLSLENEIEFESWMMDLDKWSKSIDSVSVGENAETFSIESETEMVLESELELEGWMLETDWVENHDKELVMENWMTNPRNWNLCSCN